MDKFERALQDHTLEEILELNDITTEEALRHLYYHFGLQLNERYDYEEESVLKEEADFDT